MTKKELKKLHELRTKDTLQRLSEHGMLLENRGGDVNGIEWVSVGVTLKKGKKLDNAEIARAAEVLAMILPARILEQAAEVSRSMKEKCEIPVAECSGDWLDAAWKKPLPSGLSASEGESMVMIGRLK